MIYCPREDSFPKIVTADNVPGYPRTLMGRFLAPFNKTVNAEKMFPGEIKSAVLMNSWITKQTGCEQRCTLEMHWETDVFMLADGTQSAAHEWRTDFDVQVLLLQNYCPYGYSCSRLMSSVSLCFFPRCCDKLALQRQIKGGGIYLSSWFQF